MRVTFLRAQLSPLTTGSGSPGKYYGLALSKSLFKKRKHKVIVHDRVQIVHPVRVGAIMIRDIGMRDPLAKICLEISKHVGKNRMGKLISHFEAIHAQVKELVKLSTIPLPRCRARHVENGKTRLPQIPLPDFTVRPLD